MFTPSVTIRDEAPRSVGAAGKRKLFSRLTAQAASIEITDADSLHRRSYAKEHFNLTGSANVDLSNGNAPANLRPTRRKPHENYALLPVARSHSETSIATSSSEPVIHVMPDQPPRFQNTPPSDPTTHDPA
jgi:hypothetical protein